MPLNVNPTPYGVCSRFTHGRDFHPFDYDDFVYDEDYVSPPHGVDALRRRERRLAKLTKELRWTLYNAY